MARRATVEDIRKAGEIELTLPGVVDEQGEPLTGTFRKVHAGERNALLPPTPGHLFKDLPEDPDERQKMLELREEAWLKTLAPEELEKRRFEAADFCCRLVALASVEPKLTVDDARAFGDGAVDLAGRILDFSRNGKAAPATAATE